MIGKLTGRIEAVGETHVVIDVNGVGYEVHCSARTLRNLRCGDETSLAIDTYVREDAIRLYGFASEVERSWFRILQTVQGVGAKVALGLLGTLAPDQLGNAIALQDWAAVAEAPGIGKKLAQRIVAELKHKVPALPIAAAASFGQGHPSRTLDGTAAAEAVSALTNLGYQPAQASAAIAAALRELGGDADTARLIRTGLRELAR